MLPKAGYFGYMVWRVPLIGIWKEWIHLLFILLIRLYGHCSTRGINKAIDFIRPAFFYSSLVFFLMNFENFIPYSLYISSCNRMTLHFFYIDSIRFPYPGKFSHTREEYILQPLWLGIAIAWAGKLTCLGEVLGRLIAATNLDFVP